MHLRRVYHNFMLIEEEPMPLAVIIKIAIFSNAHKPL